MNNVYMDHINFYRLMHVMRSKSECYSLFYQGGIYNSIQLYLNMGHPPSAASFSQFILEKL